MYQALKLKYPAEDIPSERTIYRIMEETGLSHKANIEFIGVAKTKDSMKTRNTFHAVFLYVKIQTAHS